MVYGFCCFPMRILEHLLCYCVFCLLDHFAVAFCCVVFYAIFAEDFSLIYQIEFVMGVLWFTWSLWLTAG